MPGHARQGGYGPLRPSARTAGRRRGRRRGRARRSPGVRALRGHGRVRGWAARLPAPPSCPTASSEPRARSAARRWGRRLERAEWLAGQDPENVNEFGWAMAGEDVLYPELERELAEMAVRVGRRPVDRPRRLRAQRDGSSSRLLLRSTGRSSASRSPSWPLPVSQGGSTTISRSSSRGASRSTRSPCRYSFAMARPTCSSPRPTASGWPRTSRAASSRSTTQRATWDPTPCRR